MIQINDKQDCCGCEACSQRCPKQCISMQSDTEGFLYPHVNVQNCINCGLCEKVCPVINKGINSQPTLSFAAKANDPETVLHSSSGGIFTLLANYTLKQNGVVFGARFDKDWNIIHDYTEDIKHLDDFRRSKYVQSKIGDAYKKAEQFLKANRQVLFSGTPCQIKGLKLYLRKEYTNLFTVDIACHGVPSPTIWSRYLKEQISPRTIEDISDINFRDKKEGWEKYYFTITFNKPGMQVSMPASQNTFMKAFLSDLILRPSCYNCCTKIDQCYSDLTIADFWGIQQTYPQFYNKNGVSIIICRSEKGYQLTQELNMQKMPIELNSAIPFNGGLRNDSYPHKKRERFFKQSTKTKDIIKLTEQILRPDLSTRIKFIIKSHLKRIK